jgi:hypothetical protein
VGGVIDHSPKETQMRRITNINMGLRVALFTLAISLIVAIEPLVALAGQGNPGGA